MDSKKLLKVAPFFCCQYCDYTTSKKSSFDKHLRTDKHKNMHNGSKWVVKSCQKLLHTDNLYTCSCGKLYKYESGFYRHKKKCVPHEVHENKEEDLTEKDLILMLIKQNTQLIEQNAELVKNGSMNNNYNTTNINSNNKSFNLQFFLNETCKDAMNIMDFVDSIKLELSDLEKVGEMGYVNGMSSIIIKHLKDLDITQRPVHCTDKKREIMYIKDDNKWEKEDDEKRKMRKFIKKVANKNIRLLQIFKEVHPDCNDSDSNSSDQYNKIIVESMGGSGNNDLEKEDKIIRKIAKEVIIDKNVN
jgi:hypothetical protein